MFADRLDEAQIMYDERLDRGQARGVLARGVLWLGAAEGHHARDRISLSGCTDRVAGPPLLGDAHGPRLLELLNAACG